MKLLLLALLCYAPTLCQGQDPPRYTNAILVKGTSFQQVKSALLDSGFFIDQQNEQDGTIITKRKGFCNCPNKDFYQLVYYIRVKDSTATIRAKFSAAAQMHIFSNDHPHTDDKDDFEEVQYRKSKILIYHYLFGLMQEFAGSLKGQMNYATIK